MAEAYAEGEYADPGDHSETTLTNSNYRGGAFEGAETGTKGKLRSHRTPRSPPTSASEIRAPQLSISHQEFSQLKIILKETVSLFSQNEVQRKKNERTKKILLFIVLLLTNCLSVISTNYLTNILNAQCQCPGSTLQHHSTLPKARLGNWITEGTPQSENTEGPTTQKDQWSENTEDSPIEAKITINVSQPSKLPKQVNINNKTFESIWVD